MDTNGPHSSLDPLLAIDIAGLSKSFNNTLALRDVRLQLGWGETLALFGPNGAGKSTLLRTLATLVRPDRGSVFVAGFDRDKQAALVRSVIGYVGHQPLLYDEMSPRENLRFYARMYGLADAEQRIDEVIDDVGARRWMDRRVQTLSNGMQKRVALARSLLHRPRLLLFDEPETGLDESGLELLEVIVRGVTRGGASVVMSTHGTERGLKLADRVVVLVEGRVVVDCDRAETSAASVQSAVAGRVESAP